ncbi:hypothetical protein BB561_003394 [Smittium simulii]|uniref:proline--tRNA ligase n=1 Tax=Smittium simulii TaxID=133385 RepID=A0A2T9YLM2_9FUNG|nr:hypothetical protein BB561_003394 [Smittium simulii]
MQSIGGQKMTMPSLLPIEPWVTTKRYETMNNDLFKVNDRKGTKYILGPTFEEEITTIVANDNISYKKLPLRLYQISNKFRDEMRPRSLLLRGREFLMKDMYTFDSTEKDALISYKSVLEAYHRIFKRVGVDYALADADSGDIGGSLSQEFHIFNQDGEDNILNCETCGYTANEEKAVGIIKNVEKISYESFTRWISDQIDYSLDFSISVYLQDIIPKSSQSSPTDSIQSQNINIFIAPHGRNLNMAKCKSFFSENLDLLGNRVLNLNKNIDFSQLTELINTKIENNNNSFYNDNQPLNKNIKYNFRYFVDQQAIDIPEMTHESIKKLVDLLDAKNSFSKTENILHETNVLFSDLVNAENNDQCKKCSANNISSNLVSRKAIEIGHIFYLGTKYSLPLNAKVALKNSTVVPIEMGCYGIGVMRYMQTAVDSTRDNDGLIWPLTISPFSVYILPLLPKTLAKGKSGVCSIEQLIEASNSDDPELQTLISGINKITKILELKESKELSNSSALIKNKQKIFDSENILLDDRFHLATGYKLYDSEMIGIPFTIILGADFFSSKGAFVELKIRKYKNIDNNQDSQTKHENKNKKQFIYRKVPIEDLPSLIFENK